MEFFQEEKKVECEKEGNVSEKEATSEDEFKVEGLEKVSPEEVDQMDKRGNRVNALNYSNLKKS